MNFKLYVRVSKRSDYKKKLCKIEENNERTKNCLELFFFFLSFDGRNKIIKVLAKKRKNAKVIYFRS